MKKINNIEELNIILENNTIVFLYFSTPTCNVCKALLPKVESLLKDYPEIETRYVDMTQFKELSSRFSIFTFPTVILYVDGKETIRQARFVSINEFKSSLNRYYSIIYD